MKEYNIDDLFDITFIPDNTPLYIILTGGSGDIEAEGVLDYPLEALSIIRVYLETGIIDIIQLFGEVVIDIDELVDAFCYLLCLYKPDFFPVEYWFATLSENWVLEQWSKGNTPDDNRWLIDITEMAYKMYAHPLSIVNNPNYVIAGSYPLSLIDPNIEPHNKAHDVHIFYIGEDETLDAGDNLFVNIHEVYIRRSVDTIEDVIQTEYYNTRKFYQQYNDGTNICHKPVLYNGHSPTWKLKIKNYPSASHVLISFNIDCEKVCCIGGKIFASPCGYYAIKNKVNKITNNMRDHDELRDLFEYNGDLDYHLIGRSLYDNYVDVDSKYIS